MRCEDLLCQLCPRIPLRGDLLHQNSLLLELFIEKEKKKPKVNTFTWPPGYGYVGNDWV